MWGTRCRSAHQVKSTRTDVVSQHDEFLQSTKLCMGMRQRHDYDNDASIGDMALSPSGTSPAGSLSDNRQGNNSHLRTDYAPQELDPRHPGSDGRGAEFAHHKLYYPLGGCIVDYGYWNSMMHAFMCVGVWWTTPLFLFGLNGALDKFRERYSAHLQGIDTFLVMLSISFLVMASIFRQDCLSWVPCLSWPLKYPYLSDEDGKMVMTLSMIFIAFSAMISTITGAAGLVRKKDVVHRAQLD